MNYKKLSEIATEIGKKEDRAVIICTTKSNESDKCKLGYYANNRELLDLLEHTFSLIFQKITGLSEVDFAFFLQDPLRPKEYDGLIEAFKKTKEEIYKIKRKADKIK